MTYARDPFDTDEPPCFCAGQDSGRALTTEEFCPACGDPDKPAPEPPDEPKCECHGTGAIEVGGCTCGTGPGGYYGMHERGCGLEPCPAGCEYNPESERQR